MLEAQSETKNNELASYNRVSRRPETHLLPRPFFSKKKLTLVNQENVTLFFSNPNLFEYKISLQSIGAQKKVLGELYKTHWQKIQQNIMYLNITLLNEQKSELLIYKVQKAPMQHSTST
jgi:hypothetical protein